MREAELAHQYVVRDSGAVRDERLYWDKAVRFLYSSVRENAPRLFAALTSARVSSFLAFLNYESFVGRSLSGSRRFLAECGIDLMECADDPATLRSLGQIFERKIRYWEKRPMAESAAVVVAPADARMVWGSLRGQTPLLIKGKLFEVEELLGPVRDARRFSDGDWAIFRLTPDKYHYNHLPVAGVVTDFAAISGACHACNPSAVVEMVNPYAKNRRDVTIIDTDVAGGSGVGLVAMVEVAALMIGGIVQCYSEDRYHAPRAMEVGMFLRRGAPKSRYRPGGSTDVLLFEAGRIRMNRDLVRAQQRSDVHSRWSLALGVPWVESEVQVRSPIAERAAGGEGSAFAEPARRAEPAAYGEPAERAQPAECDHNHDRNPHRSHDSNHER
ncbi:MAG: phosphatidylserine decarboxylase [Polyangia bacterium]|jgi:phosphatidylserine decarboxylase